MIDKIIKIIAILLIGVMLGYAWRIEHEKKNWDKWKKQIIQEYQGKGYSESNN